MAVDELIVAERRRCARIFGLAILGMLPPFAWTDGRVADPGIGYLLYWPLSATAGVCGVAAILGYGRRLETVGGAWFGYLRESALPVYVPLAIYHALVRPFPMVRAAFGMRAGSARGHAAAVAPLSTPSRS